MEDGVVAVESGGCGGDSNGDGDNCGGGDMMVEIVEAVVVVVATVVGKGGDGSSGSGGGGSISICDIAGDSSDSRVVD